MDSLVGQVRSFNRTVTRRIGVLHNDYLGRSRPLGECRLLFEIGVSGASANALRSRLGLDSGYLSRLLRSLERQGLVSTRADPSDRRARIAELTAAGCTELRELDTLSDALARSLLEPLDEHQRVKLGAAMAEVERLFSLSTLEIGEELPTSPAAQHCLGEYYGELQRRFEAGFNPDYAEAPALADFLPRSGAFLVVRLDGESVGCGGLKRLDDSRAYLKRMWISPEKRGLGLGRRLLEALENKARSLGYEAVCLETNTALLEARQLYLSAGYREVEPFNDEPYADHWFEKRLAD